jgi:hypothetical protein
VLLGGDDPHDQSAQRFDDAIVLMDGQQHPDRAVLKSEKN